MTLLLAAAEPSSGERITYLILAGIAAAFLFGIVWNWKKRGE